MKTFTREDLDAANAAWDEGDFSKEWRHFRHKAAMGGVIYPPSGSKWDNWEDDSPTQRAILIRAIRETPKLLDRCITGAHSWHHVIERLTNARDDWRADLRPEPPSDAPTHREAVMSLGEVLGRIRDSV